MNLILQPKTMRMTTEKNRSTLSVLFFIKRQKLLKNGEAPICMRVTVSKEKFEVMIKRSIVVSLWNQKKECSKGKDRESAELNLYINSLRTKIYTIHRKLEMDGKRITAETVKDCFYGRDKVYRTILGIFAEHNAQCRALIGKEFTENTVDKFDSALRRITEYVKDRFGKNDIPLEAINREFVTGYEFWLKTVKNLSNNSALKQLKYLRKIIRIALANRWIELDPYNGLHFKKDEVAVEFLTRVELNVIRKKDFGIARLNHVRDIFVFCCFTGLAFIDVRQLTPEQIMTDSDGNEWIRKPRQKTGQMCNIPLLHPAKEILTKYSDNLVCKAKNVLLPVPSNQKMNAYLKEIADLCGIKKRLTTHVARHTAATVVFLANEVSMENVAKILGHANIKMTQHYAKVLDSSIMRDMQKVEMNFSKA